MGTETGDKASAEAEARKTIDDLNKRVAELEGQLDQSKTALVDYQRRDAARGALKGKFEDPDAVADLLTPHLRDIEPGKVAEHIGSEDFAPRLAAFKATAAPPANGDGDGSGDGEGAGDGDNSGPAATQPGPGAFGGPSPGNDAGAKPATGGKDPIKVGTPAYYELLTKPDEYAQAEKDGRIVQATPAYR